MADRDNRLGKAKSSGFPPAVRNDKLGATDLDDLYRFNLLNKSSVGVDLSGVKKANFDVEVYSFKVPLSQIPKKIRDLDFRQLKGNRNKYLQLVGASRKGGTANEKVQSTLTAGEYLVRVTRRSGDSKYRLNLTSTLILDPPPPPPPGPGSGNSLGTAYSTTIPTTTPITGTVSDSDKQDYHKFTLSQAGTFIFNASDFQGKADLQFLDSGGNAIDTQTLDSANPQTFEKSLGAGTYYLRIYQEAAGDATTYSLTAIKATDPPPPPPEKGNSFETAIDATVPTTTSVSGTFNTTDKLDYYKFTAGSGDYQFNLSGDAKIEFFKADKSAFTTTYHAGKTKFIQPLDQGTYYFKVSQQTAAASAAYSLTANKLQDGVTNTVPTTSTVSLTETPTKITTNYVVEGGKSSSVDYYRFTVTEFSKFEAELRNMFGNLDVRLLNVDDVGTDLNKATPYNKPSQTTETVIPGPLDAGDYILQVFAPSGEGSTYDLYMSLSPTYDKPYISADVNSDPGGSSNAKNLVEVGNAAFFVATDKDNQTALYRTTGTIDKLRRLKVFSSVESFTYATDDAFYFIANDGTSGNDLWRATVDGAVKQVTAFTNAAVSIKTDIGQMAAVDNKLYFLANDGAGAKLYRADLSGTTPTIDSSFANNLVADDLKEMTVVNNTLFFAASEADSDRELWRIQNAGAATPDALEKIDLSIASAAFPSNLTVVGNTLYLLANRNDAIENNGEKTRLVKLSNLTGANDGNLNDASGIQATNIALGQNSFSGTTQLYLFKGDNTISSDDVLYFTANANDGTGNKGKELMKLENPLAATSSSTMTLVSDINVGSGGSAPSGLVEYNSKLYFVADDGNGAKLWYTDGTAAGTLSITEGLLDSENLASNVPYSLPGTKQLVVVGNTLYLTASSSSDPIVNPAVVNTGLELWQVKDTTLSLVQDINSIPNPDDATITLDSSPTRLTAIGGSLFFIANDGENGSEVWSVTPTNS